MSDNAFKITLVIVIGCVIVGIAFADALSERWKRK